MLPRLTAGQRGTPLSIASPRPRPCRIHIAGFWPSAPQRGNSRNPDTIPRVWVRARTPESKHR